MRTNRRNPLFLAIFPVLIACLIPVGTAAAAVMPYGGGGLLVPGVAEITDVICLTDCSQTRTVAPGGTIQITGKDMSSVTAVSIAAIPKRVRVKPDRVTSTRVEATVPKTAKTGRIRVISAGGTPSNIAREVLRIGAATPARSGRVRVTDASTSPSKAFQFGTKLPRLNFIVNSGRPVVDLRIDVLNGRGDVVRSSFRKQVRTGTRQSIAWAGKVQGGKLAPNGAYRYVIRAADGTAAVLSKRLTRQRTRARRLTRATDPFAFRLYRFIFPLPGAHSYGQGVGSGRGHQGVDIMARCGMPIRAARAGTVYYNAYEAAAGNYLVINLKGAGRKSHVYMHMPRRSRFKVGAKVRTGQVIGRVGTTGRSSACHLHFEQWSAPGWYQGGTFMNPMRPLKRWDRYS